VSEFVDWWDIGRGMVEVGVETVVRATRRALGFVAVHETASHGDNFIHDEVQPPNVIHMDRWEDEAYSEADLFLHKDGA
jgi:hypothetical protein